MSLHKDEMKLPFIGGFDGDAVVVVAVAVAEWGFNI